MAYQQSSITAITDIPALVNTFAVANGWTVTGTSSSPILTRTGGGLSFQLDAAISGNDHTLTWTETGSTATNNARIVSPKLAGTSGTPVVSTPSKVHLFAAATPQPFLAIVVEYGSNSFRHLYLGNLVKASAFTGGEVISGANPRNTSSAFEFPLGYRNAQYLFGGTKSSAVGQANAGGLKAAHASNPTPWRRFYCGSWAYPYYGTFDGSEAIGGFCDDVNDGYVARGRSAFSGVQILVPINLYAAMPVTGDTLFAPLGHPAGVRMVNLTDIEPGADILIGSQTWKCFPAFTKGGASVTQGSGGGWGVAETSSVVGYAYPKN